MNREANSAVSNAPKDWVRSILLILIVAGAIWVYHDMESDRGTMTLRELNRFSTSLAEWVRLQNQWPESTLPAMLAAMEESDPALYNRVRTESPLVLEGVDAWGTPLAFTYDPTIHRATITSAGPNERHEGGKGDDISPKTPELRLRPPGQFWGPALGGGTRGA